MPTDQTSATSEIVKCDSKGKLDETNFPFFLKDPVMDLSILIQLIEKIDALDRKIDRIFGNHVFVNGKIVQLNLKKEGNEKKIDNAK